MREAALPGRFAAPPALVVLAALVFALLVLAGLGYGLLLPEDHNTPRLLMRLRPPGLGLDGGRAFPFGTDQLGRDIFLRCLKGLEVSLAIAVLGTLGGALIGLAVGLVAGYAGGWPDRLLMMLVDTQLALPNLLIILAGIAVLGTDFGVLVLMIALARWEGYARLARGLALRAREEDHVEAARAIGAGPARILVLHVLPGVLSPLAVMISLNFPAVLLLEASLSFLGIGVQPPTPSLGRMVAEGRDWLATAPWVSFAPAAVILGVTLSAQIVGDWARDRLDVRRGG